MFCKPSGRCRHAADNLAHLVVQFDKLLTVFPLAGREYLYLETIRLPVFVGIEDDRQTDQKFMGEF